MNLEQHANRRLREALSEAHSLAERLEACRQRPHQPGSRLALDDAATNPFHLSHAALSLCASSLDHLLTLGDLVRDAALRPTSPYSLSRAAVENAAGSLFLLAPDDRRKRVLRRLQFAADDLDDNAQAHALVGQAMRPAHEDKMRQLEAIATAAGIAPGTLGGRRPRWGTIVAAADKHLGGVDGELAWRVCSGFTHARQWAALTALDRGPVEDKGGDVLMLSMSASVKSLAMFTMTASRIATAAVEKLERGSRVWIGTGPDVESPID